MAECIRGRKALEGATLAESNWENLDEEVEVEEGEKEQTKSSSGKGKQNPNLFLADALQTGMTAVAAALAGRGSTDLKQILAKLEEQNKSTKELNSTLLQMSGILARLADKLDK